MIDLFSLINDCLTLIRVLAVLNLEDCGLNVREVSVKMFPYFCLYIPAETLQNFIEERHVLRYSGVVVLLESDSQLFLHERAHIIFAAVGSLLDRPLKLSVARASGHVLLLQLLVEPLDNRSLGCLETVIDVFEALVVVLSFLPL